MSHPRTNRSIQGRRPGTFSSGLCFLLTLALDSGSKGNSQCEALLVRSEGGGGLATGMAYNAQDDQAVIAGTAYDKSFWNLNNPSAQQPGECFVAVGDVAHSDQSPLFARTALDTPAVCFGGTTPVSGMGIASVLGMELAQDSNNENVGFSHYVMYYKGTVQSPATKLNDFPPNLLAVASTSGIEESAAMYIGLHQIRSDDTPFGQNAQPDAPSNMKPLQSLMLYWWRSTFPPNAGLLTGATSIDPSTLSQDAPHVRKQDIFSGSLFFDVSLPPTNGATALVADLVVPSPKSSVSRRVPLIVVGSTNGADNSNSLFGQTSTPKSASLTDFDGYILFLDPTTGSVLEEGNAAPATTANITNGTDLSLPADARPAIRINSKENANDFIQGLCLSPDERYLYVVGTTDGIITGDQKGGAFVVKYDLETPNSGSSSPVTMQWQYQISGLNVQGLACAADADAVYLGGSTQSVLWKKNGQQPTLSPDGFVTRISAMDGTAEWTQSLDTTFMQGGDHRREVIVGMDITNKGYVLVLLNSMNLKTGLNDLVLLDMDPSTGANDLSKAIKNGVTAPGSRAHGSGPDKRVMIMATVIPVTVAILLFGFTYWRHQTDIERLPKSMEKDIMEIEEKQTEISPRAEQDEGTEVV